MDAPASLIVRHETPAGEPCGPYTCGIAGKNSHAYFMCHNDFSVLRVLTDDGKHPIWDRGVLIWTPDVGEWVELRGKVWYEVKQMAHHEISWKELPFGCQPDLDDEDEDELDDDDDWDDDDDDDDWDDEPRDVFHELHQLLRDFGADMTISAIGEDLHIDVRSAGKDGPIEVRKLNLRASHLKGVCDLRTFDKIEKAIRSLELPSIRRAKAEAKAKGVVQ